MKAVKGMSLSVRATEGEIKKMLVEPKERQELFFLTEPKEVHRQIKVNIR